MIRRRPELVALVAILVGCSREVRVCELAERNPTSYTFASEPTRVKTCLRKSVGPFSAATLSADATEWRVNSGAVNVLGASTVYRDGSNNGFPYLAELRVSVAEADARHTRVEVVAKDARVITGRRLNIVLTHGGLLVNESKPVQPTSIEEYEMLRTIGTCLGEAMPPTKYPAPGPCAHIERE
jgi:hypothetical protein